MNAQAPSVVVFDREGHLASLQRPVLRAMGAFNNGLVCTEQALLKELVIGREIVLLNWSEDWDGLVELVKTIRHRKTSPDPFCRHHHRVADPESFEVARGCRCRGELAAGNPVLGGAHHDPHPLFGDEALALHRRAELFWSRPPGA